MTKVDPPHAVTDDPGSGLVLGGRGGPEHELLEDGQEEVFSRYEVEHGLIEHHSEPGGFGMDPIKDRKAGTPGEPYETNHLGDIEALIRRVRAGQITEKAALERIGAMTRQMQTEDTLQKPRG
ncbi:MAG: hypothetical protein ABW026_19360 [Microvirga sp.]